MQRRQDGMSLTVTLLFLVIMAVLGVSMFKSATLDETLAGNTREKQRSLQAAEGALEYGEWWLAQGNGGTGINCSTVLTAPNMQVCSNALANPTTLPWSTWINVPPTGMTVAKGGGLVAPGGDVNYAGTPSVYLQYLGMTGQKNALYRITGAGYGGGNSAISVVQSVYAMQGLKTTALSDP